jgi:uncharacterized protein YndB with AHSA1/START domain
MTMTGSATAHVPADPNAVFRTITNIEGLPAWNARMTQVIDQPATVEAGAVWVVEFHVFGRTWRSRSTVDELDAGARRFVYRTRTDDGNPSEATWTWTVVDDHGGSRVTVAWSLQPRTFWRRVLFGRIRNRQLTRTELPASLAALASATKVAGTAG